MSDRRQTSSSASFITLCQQWSLQKHRGGLGWPHCDSTCRDSRSASVATCWTVLLFPNQHYRLSQRTISPWQPKYWAARLFPMCKNADISYRVPWMWKIRAKINDGIMKTLLDNWLKTMFLIGQYYNCNCN